MVAPENAFSVFGSHHDTTKKMTANFPHYKWVSADILIIQF